MKVTEHMKMIISRLEEANFTRVIPDTLCIYKKQGIFVNIESDMLFVEKIGSQNLVSLACTEKWYGKYKYEDIPIPVLMDWLCGNLSKLEMNLENYVNNRALEEL